MSRARTPSRPAADARSAGRRRSAPRPARAAWPCSWRSPWSSAAFYFAVTRGIELHRGPVLLQAEDYPGPGTGKVDLPGPGGRHRRRDGPRPEGRRASSPPSTPSPRPRPPTRTRPASRSALPAEEGDGGRRRPRGPRRPGEHRARTPSRSPRGCGSTTSSTLLAKKTDFPQAAYEKVLEQPGALGLPDVRRRQRRGLPVPGDLRLRPEGDPDVDPAAMVDALAAGRRRRRPRGRRGRARLHAGEMMTVASLVRPRRRGEDRARSRGSSTTGSRATRPTGCSRSTPRSTTALGQKLGVALTTDAAAAGHAVQHLHATRACRRPRSRRPATRPSPRRPTRRRAAWFYYVTVEPAHRGDQVRRDLRRVPAVQARAAASTAQTVRRVLRPVTTAPRRSRSAVGAAASSGTRSRTRSRRCCTGPGTPRSAWTGATTPSGWPRTGWPTSSPGSTRPGAGLSLTMPLKRTALALAAR